MPVADIPPVAVMASTQAVTPLGPKQLRYFFTSSVPIEAPDFVADVVYNTTESAFKEDKRTMEAQQRMIDIDPNVPLSATQHDRGAVRFRRLIEQYAMG